MANRNYKNCKIYCIRNFVDDDVYIGSTTQPLSKRMVEHRSAAKTQPTRSPQLYNKMVELGVENFYIELVEECPCDNSEQLHKREGHYIRELGTLNKVVAGRSKKERYEDNKDDLIANMKQYYEANKNRIRAKQSEIHICSCGRRYTHSNKLQHERTKKHQEYLSSQSNTSNYTDSSDSDSN